MQKKLIALAVAGLVATPVFADVSNITIGGKLGVGYVDWSNKNDAAVQNKSDGNGVAIKGEEDLGGGLKAFFHIETRFDIGTGSAPAYDEASKIGISGGFGSIEFGKVNTVMDKVGYDPGGLSDTSGFNGHRAKAGTKYSNGWLYAGTFGPATVYASHHLSEAYAAKNDYAIGAAAKFGMVDVSAGFQKGADQWQTFLVGAKFSLDGGVVIGTTFSSSKGYNWNGSTGLNKNKRTSFGIGIEAPVGPGTIGATYSHGSGKDDAVKVSTFDKFGVAYRYPITKRTRIDTGLGYIKYKKNDKAEWGFGDLRDDAKSTMGIDARLVHEF